MRRALGNVKSAGQKSQKMCEAGRERVFAAGREMRASVSLEGCRAVRKVFRGKVVNVSTAGGE